jgi:hypothetical protein
MKEKTILALSILISTFGIILLLTISLTQEPKLVKINQINNNFLNQKIKTSGHVSRITNLNNFQIITLNESKEIEIINNHPKNLSKNQKIIIIGKVQEYKNKLQINSEKLYITTLKLP